MSESVTRASVRELYEAYGRGDVERLAALIHDDIDWVIYGPITVFPFAGARRGRAAVLEALAEIAKSYSLASYNVEVTIVDGDRAAVMSNVAFRQRATGRMLRFRVANFLRIQDGRLVEFREFADSFDQVEQALGRVVEI